MSKFSDIAIEQHNARMDAGAAISSQATKQTWHHAHSDLDIERHNAERDAMDDLMREYREYATTSRPEPPQRVTAPSYDALRTRYPRTAIYEHPHPAIEHINRAVALLDTAIEGTHSAETRTVCQVASRRLRLALDALTKGKT